MAKKTAKKTAKKASRKTAVKAVRKTAAKTAAKASRKSSRKKRVARVADLCIDLDSEQGIRDVAELHQRLLAAADHAARVTIDASSIERVDTAVLQVLAALIIERKRQDKAVDWKQPSEVFCQAASIIDLTGHLDLPQPPVKS